MVEIPVNCIDDRYKKIADLLSNTEVPESLTLDTYNRFPIDASYIDYGYIKISGGFAPQMFVACTPPNEFKPNELYLSKDGSNWINIVLPNDYCTAIYNKLVIYNGDVYMLYDDEVIRIYNFDIITQTADVERVKDEIYDIEICNHELFLLSNNGVYKIGHEDITPEFIEVAIEISPEMFVPSLDGKLIIMGYTEGYPIFVVVEDSPRYVLCTTKCVVNTAISFKDKILCYTNKNLIIDVHLAYDILEAKETVYEGHQWCGNVTYHHCYFWLSYIEYDNDGVTYTVIAKSANGINFDPDVKIPHVSNKDGVCVWGNSYTFCLCAGNIYMMKSSEKYSDYGFPLIQRYVADIESDGSVIIETDDDVSDFDRYIFSPYLIGDDMIAKDTSIRYDTIPYIDSNGNIHFKLVDGDYSGMKIQAYFYGVAIIY